MKLMIRIFTLSSIAAAILIFGCEEPISSSRYQKEAVVNATLFGNQNIDSLWLNWTGEVDKYYDPKALAISGATVIVTGVDIPFTDTLAYDNNNPGRYYSIDSLKTITPAKTYRLYIKTPDPDSRIITAETTVPDTFRIIESTIQNNSTIEYNVFLPVNKFVWSPSRFQATYLPTITYLDENAAMIPKAFYSDTTSPDFQRPSKVGYRIGVPKDQTNSDVPWIFLTYYGNLRFDVYAVDFNYSDFLNQAIPAQGGELKEIRYNTTGGIGVFGAKTKAFGGINAYLKPL